MIRMIDQVPIHLVSNPFPPILFIKDLYDQVPLSIKPVGGGSIVETVREVQEIHLDGQEADEEY